MAKTMTAVSPAPFFHIFGLLLVSSGSFFIGMYCLHRAKYAVEAAEESARLLQFFAQRMEAEAPPCRVLFAEAAESGRFPHLHFPERVACSGQERPFSDVLTEEVKRDAALIEPVRAILLQLSSFLGLRSKSETASALRELEQQISDFLPPLRKRMQDRTRLYPTLGLLGGIFLDILLL